MTSNDLLVTFDPKLWTPNMKGTKGVIVTKYHDPTIEGVGVEAFYVFRRFGFARKKKKKEEM